MESSVQVGDKRFRVLRSRTLLEEDCDRVAASVQRSLEGVDRPLFLCMLNGAFVFAADLLRRIPGACDVEFIRFSSYDGLSSRGEMQEVLGLKSDVRGRHVVVVEDIIDTGLTMRVLQDELKRRGAASVQLAAMFFKREAFKEHYTIDHIGYEVPNLFVIGYGLDYGGLGRNLPDLYVLDEESNR